MASPESHSRDTLDTLDTVKSRDDAMRSRDTLESIGAVDDDVTRSAGSISVKQLYSLFKCIICCYFTTTVLLHNLRKCSITCSQLGYVMPNVRILS